MSNSLWFMAQQPDIEKTADLLSAEVKAAQEKILYSLAIMAIEHPNC
jgi:hypothetical protein